MCSRVTYPVINSGMEQMVKTYPPPMATHDEVVKSPTIFWDTIKAFHAKMGTKNMVPVIGGKKLNLHVLYVEVTKRGGYEKVVELKKWKEVSRVFEFSSSTTSASYALRKNYYRFLLDYEQAYFFRKRSSVPPDSTTGTLSFQATVTINGKFDCGYLASMKVGDDVFKGVLYRSAPSPPPPPAANRCRDMVLYKHSPQQSAGRRKRRRRDDPNHPKPNRSGYNFFFSEKHSVLKSLHTNRQKGEFVKMIGHAWNNLSPEEKMVYQNYGVKDKERYQQEKREYNVRLNAQNRG